MSAPNVRVPPVSVSRRIKRIKLVLTNVESNLITPPPAPLIVVFKSWLKTDILNEAHHPS